MKMIKINRLAAWVLFLGLILYFFSGYGMTKGLISYSTAQFLHNKILPYFVSVAFVIHAAFATRLALMRWRVWQGFARWIWGVVFLGIVVGFVYLFVAGSAQPVSVGSNKIQSPVASLATSASSTSTASLTNQKTFTQSDLSKYDGLNGRSAYVAVDGIVYDMSEYFKNGTHHGFTAGKDLSSAFHSQHPDSLLSGLTIVGKMAN